MKKIIFLSLLAIPFISKAQFTITNSSTLSLLQVRDGDWPVELQRVIKETDTSYVLEFRDQQYSNVVNMTDLRFGNLEQVRYFMKALAELKKGGTGETANFKGYTLKRYDVKGNGGGPKAKAAGIWYTLTLSEGEITNFQQTDADRMIAAIRIL